MLVSARFDAKNIYKINSPGPFDNVNLSIGIKHIIGSKQNYVKTLSGWDIGHGMPKIDLNLGFI
jgi:hypothetical protein